MKKHLISFILVFSLIFCCVVPASAEESRKVDVEIVNLVDGVFYTCKVGNDFIALTIPTEGEQMEINYTNELKQGIVYQFYVSKNQHLSTASTVDWEYLLSYCKRNLEDANLIEFKFDKITYDKPIEVSMTRSAASDDLKDDLVAIHGVEYFGDYVTGTTYQGERIAIYQRLDYRIYKIGYTAWDATTDTLSLGSFITGRLGKPVTSALLDALATVFGVLPTASAYLSGKGVIDEYQCAAYFCRYATVNNSQDMYNTTDKVYTYMGYDDSNVNSYTDAAVDVSSQSMYYTDSMNYYYDTSAQIADAYAMYVAMN